jgi:translation initiation factor IF-2
MVQIYLFGSILKDEKQCTDIDILVVSTSETVPRQLREEMEHLNELHPVDILIMTKNEEKQFMFIKEQGAVPVWEFTQQSHARQQRSGFSKSMPRIQLSGNANFVDPHVGGK